MTRFEEIGVERQYGSTNPREAVRNYERSCKICCERGVCLNCQRCSIPMAHRSMMQTFAVLGAC